VSLILSSWKHAFAGIKEEGFISGIALNWNDLYGTGKGIWRGDDAQDYVNRAREERNRSSSPIRSSKYEGQTPSLPMNLLREVERNEKRQ